MARPGIFNSVSFNRYEIKTFRLCSGFVVPHARIYHLYVFKKRSICVRHKEMSHALFIRICSCHCHWLICSNFFNKTNFLVLGQSPIIFLTGTYCNPPIYTVLHFSIKYFYFDVTNDLRSLCSYRYLSFILKVWQIKIY